MNFVIQVTDGSGKSDVARDGDRSGETRGLKAQFRDFSQYFGQLQHAKVLIAQSLVWFLL